MKIIYCTHSTCNPGGMERVLLNKVTYLSQLPGWKVAVVTTDQHQRPPFYPFPEKVRMTDLGINYSEDNEKRAWKKITGYLRKRKEHKRKLTALLLKEKPDIVVSLYPSESSFIPDIKDGSRKVLELHYCKFFRLQYGRRGLLGWIDKLRTRQDEQIVRRFDKFVVLTNEDRGYWGNLPNIEVIPNAAMHVSDAYSDVMNKRVIAVGRYEHQKGFDLLLKAWKEVANTHKDWTMHIYGEGILRENLQKQLISLGLEDSCFLEHHTLQIGECFKTSSLFVLSSRFEGWGLVIVEAMAYGLPVVSFACPCGPKEIIVDGVDGFLVEPQNIKELACKISYVIENEEIRKTMGYQASVNVHRYDIERIVPRWVQLFEELTI